MSALPPFGAGLSIEVLLREQHSQCQLLAYLADSEHHMSEEVRSGLVAVFGRMALTCRAIQRALPDAALNIEIPTTEESR